MTILTDRQTDRQTDNHCHACGQYIAQAVNRLNGPDGRFVLYNNDFRDIAADIQPGGVDAVIADPPYGSGGFTVKDMLKSSKTKYVSSDASYQKTLPDIDGESLHPMAWRQLMTDACNLAKKVLTDGGVLVLFIDWRNMAALQAVMHETGFTVRGTAVWDKGRATRPMKNGFRNQAEYLLWGTKGKTASREQPVYLPGVLKHTTMTNKKIHITQKPDSLMDEIIAICPDGGTVLDMFMGSGSTGVAALKSGRRFIGCESVPAYFDTARQRCNNALND
ncbi:DNA-methyltransferase [Methylobacter marinus]|uniref:DNA-methyltransferase n=1 Tax=Methylobacter marinus TaxID=34058 RepID=UPI00039E6DDF|nr:site-specific DNA-methyltransferase [Methylobacter marinus]